jgi:hypothetical protein
MNSRLWSRARKVASNISWLIVLLVMGIARGQEGCLDECCLDTCGDTWRARAEYLCWWTKGNAIPPLVTTSPDGTLRTMAGVLHTPGFEILFGGENIDDEVRPGGRLTLSRWLDDSSQLAVEGVFLYLGEDGKSGDFAASSLGSRILARPFFNVTSNAEDAELVVFPDVLNGRVDVASSSEIYSAELLGRWNSRRGSRGSIDLLGGYRYFHLDESLSIREQLTSVEIGGLVPLGTQFDLSDRFSTNNDFHGGQLGVAAEFWRDCVSLELSAKLALGNLRRHWQVSGDTVTQIPGLVPTTEPGGLLALPTNIGTHTDNQFAVLSEFGVNGTVLLTSRLSVVCGYSLLLLNQVARTGDQIDRNVNTSQIGGGPLVGPAQPAGRLGGSDFWAQGVNIGLDYRW